MKRIFAFIVCCLLLFSASAVAAVAEEERPLTFYFIDAYGAIDSGTKWGDCTLITFPNGEVMLLDTGIRAAAPIVIQKLKDHGVEKIDYLVLSHPHSDHQGSIREILAEFEVMGFYGNLYAASDARWGEAYVREQGLPVNRLVAGDSFTVGDVAVHVLWPLAEDVEVPPEAPGSLDSTTVDVNNHSLVLRFDYAGKSALFTGDLHKMAELAVLETNGPEALKADLLKIMHHGHSTSGTDPFLDAVMPSYAVSMGGVVMTLPEYLKYVKRGCWPYSTWMNGDVKIAFYQDRIEEKAEMPEINDYYAQLEVKYPRNRQTEE